MMAKRRAPGAQKLAFVAGIVVAVLAWVKLGTMLGFGLATTTAWHLQDFPASQQFAQLQMIENSIESHKAHFNLGTSLAAQGQLEDAAKSLETALALTTGADDCAVRLNLSLVLEALAVEQEAQPQRTKLLDRARQVIDAAESACRTGPLAAAVERMPAGNQQAEADEEVEGDGEGGEEPGLPQPADEPNPALDEISNRMTAGTGRQHDEQRSRSPRPESGTVDKPW